MVKRPKKHKLDPRYDTRLIRALRHQQESVQQGQESSNAMWKEEIAQLVQDPRELILALAWKLDRARLSWREKLSQYAMTELWPLLSART